MMPRDVGLEAWTSITGNRTWLMAVLNGPVLVVYRQG